MHTQANVTRFFIRNRAFKRLLLFVTVAIL